MEKAQRKVQQREQEIEQTRVDYAKRIRKSSEEKDEEKSKLHDIIDQQLGKFQKELYEQARIMSEREEELNRKINELKEIKGVTEIEKSFEKEMNKLKRQHKKDMK